MFFFAESTKLWAPGISEDEAKEELEKEEAETLRLSGAVPLHGTSACSFLAMGLELEESQ